MQSITFYNRKKCFVSNSDKACYPQLISKQYSLCRFVWNEWQCKSTLLIHITLYIGYEIGGYGSCKGDSGGPIAYFSTEHNSGQYRFIQLGIVQGGIGTCGDPTLPAIYVRLEDKEVLQFIKKSKPQTLF